MFSKAFYFQWIIVIIAVPSLAERTIDNENGRHNRVLFSPRMEFAQWRPIGRGDPLQNDPTFDYVPPVLERVRYWAASDEREEETPPPEQDHQTYHFPHQAGLRAEQDVYAEPEQAIQRRNQDDADDLSPAEARIANGPVRRKDTVGPAQAPGFMRFVDAPHFRPRPIRKQPPPATMLRPPPAIKTQPSKPTTNALWVDDPSVWLSPPPVGGTTIAFPKYTPEDNDDIQVVPSKEILLEASTPMTSSKNYLTDSIAEESKLNTQSTNTQPYSGSWTLKTLLQKETDVTSQQQGTTKPYETSMQHSSPTHSDATTTYTMSSYPTTWFNKPQPTTVMPQVPQTNLVRFPQMTSTVAPNTMTTDPMFSNYKQPNKSLMQHMNQLIIQGHSKVKTYGPILNDNSLIADNIRHLHPKQSDQEPTHKHLHDKHSESDQEEEDDFKSMFENMDFGLGFLFGESAKKHKTGSKYRNLEDDEEEPATETPPSVQHLHFGNEETDEKDTPETEAKKKESTLVSLQGLVDSKKINLDDKIVGQFEE